MIGDISVKASIFFKTATEYARFTKTFPVGSRHDTYREPGGMLWTLIYTIDHDGKSWMLMNDKSIWKNEKEWCVDMIVPMDVKLWGIDVIDHYYTMGRKGYRP
jgi:hypothetical protein